MLFQLRVEIQTTVVNSWNGKSFSRFLVAARRVERDPFWGLFYFSNNSDKISFSMSWIKKRYKLFFLILIITTLPCFSFASEEKQDFYVDSSYDLSGREKISTTLIKKTLKLYFYADNEWWETLEKEEKNETEQSLNELGAEFNFNIYPQLTSVYGSEWKPGIDNDNRITVLIHPMKEGARGYFRYDDEYSRLQIPASNEREMVYLNADYVIGPLTKSFLAHEFTHLIAFNQKERRYGVEQETWLNEARAEYTPTLLGYDDDYENSVFSKRLETFLNNSSDSLIEWKGRSSDYGALNLFTQYLVEKYGIGILVDSLKSEEVGIESVNQTLEKNGFEKDFSQIFTDWTVAVLANDCSLGEDYCYEGDNLKNIKVISSVNFLPLYGESKLGVNQTSKLWSGNWYKFIGGQKGTLKIKFIGDPDSMFKVPYVLKDNTGNNFLKFFDLDENQEGKVSVSDFGSKINSVTIIPSIQIGTSISSDSFGDVSFFWEVSTTPEKENENSNFSRYLDKPVSEMTMGELLRKIEEIKNLLDYLKDILTQEEERKQYSCERFEGNLYYGLMNDQRVYCLQEFLKGQGEDIYPEGLVTGNFLSLTKKAVIKFQEKYGSDILAPLDLREGTGYFGPKTREFVNSLISN